MSDGFMGKQALVVHPDHATRILLEQWVRGEGYRAQSVSHGDEAIRLVMHAHVDLIILDQQAPDSECSDVILKLLTHPKASRIPIAFVNADADQPPIVATSRTLH